MRRPTSSSPRRRARAFCAALAACLAALGASRDARASDAVSAEIGAGLSKPTPTIASAPFEYQKIAGRWQASDPLTVSASLRLTHDFAAAPTGDTTLLTRGDWVWSGALDATYDVTKHVTLGAGLFGSPAARRDVASPFTYPTAPGDGAGATNDAFGTIETSSWNAGGALDAQYDTFDEDTPHDVDVAVDLTLGYAHYEATERLTAVDVPPAQAIEALATACTNHPTPACQSYAVAAASQRAHLEQLRLEANATLTILDHTEATLDAAYYVYDSGSPGDAGFFTSPITAAQGALASWGAGLPLLPPRWSVRPELSYRFPALSLRAYYQLTDYATGDEVGHTVGGKVQAYLDKWRPYVTASYRTDLESGQAGATSWTLGAGISRVF